MVLLQLRKSADPPEIPTTCIPSETKYRAASLGMPIHDETINRREGGCKTRVSAAFSAS